MNNLENMMEQIKKIKNGLGIQQLLDKTSKILGNPIVMFNTEYNLLAHTEANTDDPIWNEIVTQGTFSKETQIFFDSEGFIEEIANTSKSVLLKSDKLKYERISGKIYNKNKSYVANLVIVACNKAFEDNDLKIFEIICKLISKEISRNDIYQEYEQNHQENIIRNLIDENYDIKLDLAQVGILYDALESNLYIAVVDTSQCTTKYRNNYFRDLLKKIAPNYKYALYSNYIIIIISTNNETLNVNKELKEFIEIFEQNNLYAGISNKFENLFDLKKHYMEALKSMQYILESKSTQRIFPCNPKSIDIIKQIKKLKNGLGIQYFSNIALEIFGNPVLFHDMELNLLSCTENVTINDPIYEELITYGTSSNETINFFKNEGFINSVENTKTGTLLTSEKLHYDRISWKIYNNDNIMIGCLCLISSIKTFSEDEMTLFGTFCQVFSKEIDKNKFYNNYGQLYSRTVINRLITGKIDDNAFFSEDIGNLYDNIMNNLYLIVIDINQCNPKFNLTYFRKVFNNLDTVNRYAIYSNHIIIIISTDKNSFGDNSEFNEINTIFEQNNIYAGISNKFENIYELKNHYLEAVNALNLGIKNNKQRIFQHNKNN